MRTHATTMAPSPPKLRANNVGRRRQRPEFGKKPNLEQRICLRLHDLVEQTTLSNQDIAAKLGVSQEAVGKWFRGDATPGFEHWEGLAKLLKTPVRGLLPLDCQ